MTNTIVIPAKFRGPPNSGNGGYVGGAFAQLLGLPADQAVEVTLRAPVPLDVPLQVDQSGLDQLTIRRDETLIAEVSVADFALNIPAPPSFDTALSLRDSALSLMVREGGSARGMHPICFCCGADHEQGLHVFAARLDESQVVAAWETQPTWQDENGVIPVPYLWTALDCPGQIAYAVEGIRTGLLGRITARVTKPAIPGAGHVVTAWRERIEGKKHFAGSAIFDQQGELVASALAVWIGRRAD